jgi:hypothetical protein
LIQGYWPRRTGSVGYLGNFRVKQKPTEVTSQTRVLTTLKDTLWLGAYKSGRDTPRNTRNISGLCAERASAMRTKFPQNEFSVDVSSTNETWQTKCYLKWLFRRLWWDIKPLIIANYHSAMT